MRILAEQSASGPNRSPGSRSKKVTGGIVIVVIAAAAVAGYFGYGYYVSSPKPSWLFKGAYAQFSGNITYLDARDCGNGSHGDECSNRTATASDVIHLEVLAYNSSKVDMLYLTNITTTYSPSTPFLSSEGPYVTNTSEWVSIASAPSLDPTSPHQPPALNEAYANASSTTITLHNQSYAVTDYLYLVNNSTRTNILASQSVDFPIEYVYQGTGPFPTWYVEITQTNIPGLP